MQPWSRLFTLCFGGHLRPNRNDRTPKSETPDSLSDLFAGPIARPLFMDKPDQMGIRWIFPPLLGSL